MPPPILSLCFRLLCALVALTVVDTARAAASDLRVLVRLVNGQVLLENTSSTSFNVTGYTLASNSNSLLATNWRPIATFYDLGGNQSVDTNDSWLVIAQQADELTEVELFGDGGTIGAGQFIDLGRVWNPAGMGDLTMTASNGAAQVLTVDVGYLSAADFDADFDVDLADLDVWRTGFGITTGAQIFDGDADADGDVDSIDYFLWRSEFTNGPLTLGVGVGSLLLAAVPEPATLGGAAIVLFTLVATRLRRRG